MLNLRMTAVPHAPSSRLRNPIAAFAFLSVGFLCIGAAQSADALNGDWPTHGRNAQHTGYFPGNVAGRALRLRWGITSGYDDLQQVAVADGKVFLTPYTYFAATYAAAVSEKSGLSYWRRDFANSYSINPPTYDSGSVYVQRGNSSDSKIYALDAGSGSVTWNSPFSAQWERYMAPTVADGAVFVNGGSGGGVYGFNQLSGSQRFFVALEQVSGWTPAYDVGLVYTWVKTKFRAHDPVSGAIQWTSTLSGTFSGSSLNTAPCLGDGKAFLSGGGYLRAFNLSTQSQLWAVSGSFYGTPAYANGVVYGIVGGTVKAYNGATGALVRTYNSGSTNSLQCQPIVTDDTLIASSLYNTYVFDLATGVLQRTLTEGGQLSMANRTLFLAGQDGRLAAYVFVDPGNQAPVVADDAYTILEDAVSDFDVLANDSDPEGDYLFVSGVSDPLHGTAVVQADGTVRYTPDANYFGSDTFVCTVKDAQGEITESNVQVTITEVNDDPVARPDALLSGKTDPATSGNVLSNDFDVDLDPITLTGFTQPAHGTAADNGDGTFTYTPDGGFEGTDAFTYTIEDGRGGSGTGTVYVFVNRLALHGDWPTMGRGPAHDGYVPGLASARTLKLRWAKDTTLENPLQVAAGEGKVFVSPIGYWEDQDDVIALDSKWGGELWRSTLPSTSYLSAITYDNASIFIQRCSGSSNSQLWSLNAGTGAIQWNTPLAADYDNYLAPAVADGGVFAAAGTYTSGFHGFNELSGTQRFFTTLSGSFSYWTPSYYGATVYTWVNYTLKAFDPLTGVELWSTAIGSINSNSSLKTAPCLSDGKAFLVGYSNLHAVDLATHAVLWSDDRTFSGTPACSGGTVFAIQGAKVLSFNAATGAQELTYETPDTTTLMHQPVITDDAVLASDGTRTFYWDRITGDLLQTIPFGGYLSLANDTLYISNTQVELRAYSFADPGNLAPVATTDDFTILEDASAIFDVRANDFDPEGDEFIILSVDRPQHGTAELLADQTIFYEPDPDYFGNDAFVYTLRDDQGNQVQGLIQVTVTEVNDDPVARTDVIVSTLDTQLTSPDVLANDTDVDGDPISITGFTQPLHGTVADNGDGTFAYTPDGVFEGRDSFTYDISDGRGGTGIGTVELVINRPVLEGDWPTFGNGPDHQGYFGGLVADAPLILKWSRNQDSLKLNQVAVADGHVYVTHIGHYARDGFLRRLDPRTGLMDWQYTLTPSSSLNPPTYFDGAVYLQRCNHSSDTQLHKVDGATGALIWAAPHGAQWESYYAPTVASDKVWVNGGTYGGMYGFKQSDGAQLFFAGLEQYDEWTPTYHDGVVYSWVEGNFRAHSPSTGSRLWSLDLGWDWHGWSMQTVICADVGNRAYVVGSPGLHAVDLALRAESWKAPGTFQGSPSASHGEVFALAGKVVQGYDAETGELTHVFNPGGSTNLLSHAILTDDAVLASDGAKTYVFNRYTEELTQTLPVGGLLSLADDVLYIARSTGELTAYLFLRAPNEPPDPLADAAVILEDQPVVLDVLANDADPEDDTLDVYAVSDPPHGTAVRLADGTVQYTPDLNYYGSDGFTYTVTDYQGNFLTASVVIDITEVNDAPVAVADYLSTGINMSVTTGNVVANDTDADFEALVLTGFTQPAHGSVAYKGGGVFTYTPAGLFEGADSFTYDIEDPRGGTDTGTVNVTVVRMEMSGDWPTFGNGPAHDGFFDGALGSATLSLKWSAVLDTHPLNQVAIGGGRIYATPDIYFNPTYAVGLNESSGAQLWRRDFTSSYSINPPTYDSDRVYFQRGNHSSDTGLYALTASTGTIAWTAPHSAQWEDYMAPTVADGGIWVNGGYYGGMYGFDQSTGSQRFFNDDLLQYDGWTPSYDQGVVYSWVAGYFTAHDPNTGAELWSINLGWDWHGWSMDSTTCISGGLAYVTGSPGLHAIDLATHALKWTAPGTFAGTPSAQGGEVYGIKGGTVEAHDAATGALLRTYDTGVSTTLIHQPILTRDRVFVSSASKTYVFRRASGSLQSTINTGGPLALANETLYICGTNGTLYAYAIAFPNRAPMAHDDAYETDEDTALVRNAAGGVSANDEDQDSSTSAVLKSGPLHGALTLQSNGSFTYTPDQDYFGTDAFTYVQNDGEYDSNIATVSIAISPVNDAPVANDDSGSVNEGQSVNIDVGDNDTDDEDALNLASIQIVANAAHGSLSVKTDGTVDYTHDGSENFTDSFTYTIKDASGAASNTATVSITINSVNDKPVANILGSDPLYIEENELLPFSGAGTDAEDGTNVTYAWDWDDGLPNGTAQNPSHAWDTPGLYIVTLVVTDQDGLASDPVTVQVIVTPKAGERDLFLKRGKFMINWKAHADGFDKDSLTVQGWLNPAGCNALLDGATFEVSVNGVSLGVVPLTANGKGSAGNAKASLKAKTGAFSFSIKDFDLRAALGLSNTAEAGNVELAVGISVQNAGLYTDTLMAHARFDYTTRQDISSKGSFNFKTADSADGYFFAAKTTVTEDKTGAHKVSGKGYFDAPGGASLVPAGDVMLTIGGESITISSTSLTVSGGIISLAKGAHPDLAKFILDTNKELFTIQTNALSGTGVPPVGNLATSFDLLLRIEIPTAGDTIVLETTVEILRSSSTSTKWKR